MAYDLLKKKIVGRDWSIGAGFTTTTEDVDLRLAQLTTETNDLNIDITENWFPRVKKNQQAQTFVNAWIRWRDDTYRLVRSWKEGAFYKIHMAWNYLNNTTDRLRELANWRDRWQKISGMQATAPAGTIPQDAGSNPPDPGTNWWKWGAIGGTGGIIAILLGRKIAKLKQLAPSLLAKKE